MTATEVTTKTLNTQGPVVDRKIVFVTCTPVNVADYCTVTSLTTVQGAYFVASDGTIPTFTKATNVITFIDAKNLVYQGFVWGV
jgi:hypothetical protein